MRKFSADTAILTLWRDDGGQVIVEYILMLSLVVGIVGAMGVAFKRSILKLWKLFANEITAACPKCPAP